VEHPVFENGLGLAIKKHLRCGLLRYYQDGFASIWLHIGYILNSCILPMLF